MSTTVFDTPLDARSLVEASAGTGKTYALAGLFARAVIVGRLRVPEVLAVTYTVAATQELHARVLARLRQATRLAGEWQPGDPATRAGDAPDVALLRRLAHEALADGSGETPAALSQRLARAVRDMDLAAITTIHGFCQRLLAEHALAAGQPLLAAELVPANAATRHALAVAAWRQVATSAEGADFLQRSFGGIDGLAQALRRLPGPEPLLPESSADAPSRHAQAWALLHATFVDTGGEALEALLAAQQAGTISRAKDKAVPFDELRAWFACQDTSPPLRPHPHLERLGQACLERNVLKTAKAPLPRFALCKAVDDYLEAAEACDVWRLHALRGTVRQLDAADKRTFHRRDYDDLVGAVHAACVDPDVAPALARALRAQYPLVLVDEFQDTDARQWAIFERLFGTGALVLVGDPKQAIYRFRGGDVETYLAAGASAGRPPALRENFRSRPCLLDAVNRIFEGAPEDALGKGITFAASKPGGQAGDDDLLLDGRAACAITFQHVPPRQVEPAGTREWTRPESIRHAAELCAEAIREVLQHAREGRVTRREEGGVRPLLPRDCAVLVRIHEEARAVRDALARRGIPAVSAGRNSLFASPQAQDVLALLLALVSPGDERRLRAMLAMPLFGMDAATLSALEDDGDALRDWQDRLLQWRLRWDQHGPQAMLADVVASQAARLLALADGERALTHVLQLGELMQEARATALDMRGLGPQGQVDWLRAAIAHADKDDERQWPRLESDAGRVQVMTLHASKGLEFPLVFLPFSGIGRGSGNRRTLIDYHEPSGRRVLQWKTTYAHGAPPWTEACRRALEEEQAEDMRLLYVGMTRARDALWLCGGGFASHGNSALDRLLGGSAPRDELARALGPRLDRRDGLAPAVHRRLAPASAPAVPDARVPGRTLRRDWWIHSFSQLHRQRPHGVQALAEEAPAADELPLGGLAAAPPARFAGTRFGNALHDALEHCEFARWRNADGLSVPEGEQRALRSGLERHGYGRDDLDAGVRELAPLVARTLNAPLPLGGDGEHVRLCDLSSDARVAELEFHFTLADADAGALLALLQAHGIATGRRDFGAWPRLSGLMTGKIDLTCEAGGRVHVLDYKSNRLPGYEAATVDQAMAASEYDLQALLYVVAVHRWLRLRRGAAHDVARDLGGAHYLFCRGLDPALPGRGVATLAFAPALVEGVAALLSAGARA